MIRRLMVQWQSFPIKNNYLSCLSPRSVLSWRRLWPAVNVALPAIAKELSMTAMGLSWVATSFILTAAITLIPLGRLADIFYGRRRMFIYGYDFYFGVFVLYHVADAIFFNCRPRYSGYRGAMIFSTGTAMLISAFPPGERGKILGINITAVYIGLTIDLLSAECSRNISAGDTYFFLQFFWEPRLFILLYQRLNQKYLLMKMKDSI